MNTKFTYEGSVEVKKLYKGKEIDSRNYHNTGELPLFTFIVNCLAGNLESTKGGVPMFIRLYHSETDSFPQNPEDARRSYSAVPWSDVKVTNEESSASVSFTFLVSGANVSQGANIVAIYSIDNQMQENSPSAWFKIDEGIEGASIASGVSYVIIWTMTIMDASTVNKGE